MIYRIDVRNKNSSQAATIDPEGVSIGKQIAEFGIKVGAIQTARVFFIDTSASIELVKRAAAEVLADPVVESAEIVLAAPNDIGKTRIEIHLKPGVMDPVAVSTQMALADMGLAVNEVRTGRSFLFDGQISKADLEKIASRFLANGVIESLYFEAWIPTEFARGRLAGFELRRVPLIALTDVELVKLSRSGHLFLSLAEMQAIQKYYRAQKREPTDIELETLAQTWSEHCVHKTLKSKVDVEVHDSEGKVISRRSYDNLIKETIFKSTMELTDNGKNQSFCLSVFKDNAGVVVLDEMDAVCFKVETHNHPSAIEPYGGSATGAGGVIRDILGTGLAAKPIANTDIFCVADHTLEGKLPRNVIHPRRILQQIVAGVRDYGNRMGIPTINGAVYFDNRYLGNPLVFCGCVGIIPRDKIAKASQDGDAIVVMGGRTGRDGIHGATFSSAELTDTHADEFSHAVQIGNAITEKKVADVILAARDLNLFTAVTDCGAGGLSSAVGEMAADLGATVVLDCVPLKYDGLRYDEIWISEAQERMVLSVPQEKVAELLALSNAENVESIVIGTFGTPTRELVLQYHNTEVGRLSMAFMHDGIPMPRRKAVVKPAGEIDKKSPAPVSNGLTIKSGPGVSTVDQLLSLLAHPNIASKHWIIRQYDHEVQGGSVIKPLIGPLQIGPSDASVIRPKLNSNKGVIVSCGMAPHIVDPYAMTIAAIDEAVRNAVCVGADLSRLAILDNFCWPSVDDEITMGTLVRSCEACYDAAMAFGIPFISGKDSLHNQFTNSETGDVIRIPRTMLISAMGIIDDVTQCITMDFKTEGNLIGLIRPAESTPDLKSLAGLHRLVSKAIAGGMIRSAHDISDGGALTAIAEMCIASGLGAQVKLADALLFSETLGGYIVEIKPQSQQALQNCMNVASIQFELIGTVSKDAKLSINSGSIEIDRMTKAWRGTLDW